MKPYVLVLENIENIKEGDEIFVLKSQNKQDIIDLACCKEDWDFMVNATVTDISPFQELTHRLDIQTTLGSCSGLLRSKLVYLIKPNLEITVELNLIEFKGLINKKVFFSNKEEIIIMADGTKTISFTNVHEPNGSFDLIGLPKNFKETLTINYIEVILNDQKLSYPSVTIQEKISELSIILDNSKPILLKIPEDSFLKAIKNKLNSDVRKFNILLSVIYLSFFTGIFV